jgi:hydrogenase expression/formation protein HypE
MIRAVLFDFDGTLTRPGSIDLEGLRERIGCPKGAVIIEYVDGLEPPERREEALRLLEDYERRGAERSVPNKGAEETLGFLSRRGVSLGILTNNSRASLEIAMKSFASISLADFSVVLTRESAGSHKPSPDGVRKAARQFGVDLDEILVVGDYLFDVQAGMRAGAVTALLTNGGNEAPPIRPDYVISALPEIAGILGS